MNSTDIFLILMATELAIGFVSYWIGWFIGRNYGIGITKERIKESVSKDDSI